MGGLSDGRSFSFKGRGVSSPVVGVGWGDMAEVELLNCKKYKSLDAFYQQIGEIA